MKHPDLSSKQCRIVPVEEYDRLLRTIETMAETIKALTGADEVMVETGEAEEYEH